MPAEKRANTKQRPARRRQKTRAERRKRPLSRKRLQTPPRRVYRYDRCQYLHRIRGVLSSRPVNHRSIAPRSQKTRAHKYRPRRPTITTLRPFCSCVASVLFVRCVRFVCASRPLWPVVGHGLVAWCPVVASVVSSRWSRIGCVVSGGRVCCVQLLVTDWLRGGYGLVAWWSPIGSISPRCRRESQSRACGSVGGR